MGLYDMFSLRQSFLNKPILSYNEIIGYYPVLILKVQFQNIFPYGCIFYIHVSIKAPSKHFFLH